MADREQWLALAERCEKATGADDVIDWDILMTMCGDYGDTWLSAPAARYALSRGASYWAPEWTASLDAITALIERELPHYGATISRHLQTNAVRLYGPGFDNTAVAATEPLARCSAFCRAMAEKP
jgi:hypothetical protein